MSNDPCPKCKSTRGWKWNWSDFNKGDSKGYGECIACGWEDK